MFFVGIDQHLKYSYITIMDERGYVWQERKLANEKETIIKFLSHYGGELKIALEAGAGWYWLYDLLESLGQVYLVHPKKTKAIASARIKTDKIDARTLAHLLRTNLLPTSYVPSKEERALRERLRYRGYLVRKQTSLKNRIHSLLAKKGIKNSYSDLFGKRGRKFLENLPLKDVFKEVLESNLRLFLLLEEEITQLERTIKKLATQSSKARILLKLPGIAELSALTIVAEIGQALRFPTARSLCSYAGLVPSLYSSGEKIRYGRITKEGSKTLRWILIEVSQKAKRISPYREYYQRIAKRRGNKIATVSLARKLLKQIYFLLKEAEEAETNLSQKIGNWGAPTGVMA